MIKYLTNILEARAQARAQSRIVTELQQIYDLRAAGKMREQYLMKRAAELSLREIDTYIATRRAHRVAAW